MDALARVRQLFGGERSREVRYECRDCGADYGVQHFVCPACGCFSVDRREWGLE